jgi:hypothetical protein
MDENGTGSATMRVFHLYTIGQRRVGESRWAVRLDYKTLDRKDATVVLTTDRTLAPPGLMADDVIGAVNRSR